MGPVSNAHELERIFPGSSEMAHRMRSFDWSQTVLGLPETWPLNLRTCVRIIPAERDLRILDLLARQAADLIERNLAEIAKRDSKAWLGAQKEAFQAAVNGAPLEISLGILSRAAVSQLGKEARCAFYIADERTGELRHVAGVSEAYARKLHGFGTGSESLAAQSARPVIVADVSKEPRWEPWLWLVEEHEYRACWSFPIETFSSKVVGVFAIYFKEPRQPASRDLELASNLTQAASIVISRAKEAEERRRAEEAIRASLAEKEALLKEVHHRVKNNLQVIISMVNLQANQIQDDRVLALFDETRNRVHAIAAIHELLYRSASLAEIHLAGYARHLVPELARFYQIDGRVSVSVEGDFSTIEIQRAVPYGLLLNELVSNACKHAFPAGRSGRLTVSVEQRDGQILLAVSDDGVGLPQGFDFENMNTLGLKLVRMLASQLGGSVKLSGCAGTVAEVEFPHKLAAENL